MKKKEQSNKPTLPKLFVGSSSESLPIARAIQLELEHDVETIIWYQGVFEPSSGTLDDLLSLLDDIDFGVFVFSPDDVARIRKQQHRVARDNVVFEMGLFIGRIGKKRTFYIIPRGDNKLHLPSDLAGVNPLDYDASRENTQAALGAACSRIRERVSKLGKFKDSFSKDEHKPISEESIFSSQENSEFKRIYEKLKPLRSASMRVSKKHPEQRYNSTTIGKCIFKYSLIKVIWTNICEGNNTFNYHLIRHSEKAKDIAKSQLNSSEKDGLSYGDLLPDDNLTPLLSMLGLLDEQLDSDPRQMIPGFAFHIYSKKMYRFYDWIDYNNLDISEPLLEFIEFADEPK